MKAKDLKIEMKNEQLTQKLMEAINLVEDWGIMSRNNENTFTILAVSQTRLNDLEDFINIFTKNQENDCPF